MSKEVSGVYDNEFRDNYVPHDILQIYLTDRLAMIGLEVEQHGYDGDRGEYTGVKGYGPDLKVLTPSGELVCYIEIKSKRLEKSGDEWYGILDKPHWDQYLYGTDDGTDFDGAVNSDVPVVIYFGLVDDGGRIIRDGFVPVEDDDQVTEAFRVGGDIVVSLERDDFRNIHWLLHQLGI